MPLPIPVWGPMPIPPTGRKPPTDAASRLARYLPWRCVVAPPLGFGVCCPALPAPAPGAHTAGGRTKRSTTRRLVIPARPVRLALPVCPVWPVRPALPRLVPRCGVSVLHIQQGPVSASNGNTTEWYTTGCGRRLARTTTAWGSPRVALARRLQRKG